jgi:drug/metabolite transporter (DMT)-like permease
MIMSALGFAFMGMFVRIAYAQGIPVLEIVAARALISVFISYADIKRKNISPWGQRKDLLIARGVAGAIALIFVYTALAALPFAEATVLQYLHPMFTALLAIVFLREYLQKSTLVCIVLSIIGLLIMVRPSFMFGGLAGNYPLWAVAAAVAGAFGSAVAYVLVRKLNATEDSSVIIFYFPIMALPLSLFMLGDNMVMPQGWAWLSLLLVGITTQVGQVGLTKAMKTATASKATSFSYLQIIFAMVLGIIFFDEIPTMWTITGAVFIMLGVVINTWPSSHKSA